MLPQRLAHRLLHTAHGIVIPSKLAPGQVRTIVSSRANADTPSKFDRNGNPEDLKWNDPLRIISRGLLTTHREVGRNIYIYIYKMGERVRGQLNRLPLTRQPIWVGSHSAAPSQRRNTSLCARC